VVEVRRADGAGPDLTRQRGEMVVLPEAVRLRLDDGYPDPTAANPRLWRASTSRALPVGSFLDRNGRPIEYRHLRQSFPLADYQTVYAAHAGSAEMASAGRPFTAQLITRLVAAGITFAPVVLHCSVSSPEVHEPPLPERFEVPAATARLVMSARHAGNRVVAVGTTVVRALESASAPDGVVRPARGWTDLVLDQTRPARVVDGLLTGLHAPEASHLLLLEAVAGPALVAAAYQTAVSGGYLWHEFGDSMLFLPT
jgi:S-adenosylmethionine:tRNA ribosyltransferase-isomerase